MPAGRTHPVETCSKCTTLRNVPALLSNGRRLRAIVPPEGAQARAGAGASSAAVDRRGGSGVEQLHGADDLAQVGRTRQDEIEWQASLLNLKVVEGGGKKVRPP